MGYKHSGSLRDLRRADNIVSDVFISPAPPRPPPFFKRNLAIDFADGDRVVLEGTPDEVAYKGIVRLR